MFKVIIAGCRDFTDEDFVFKKVNKILSNKYLNISNPYPDVEIVSGCAKGVDTLAIRFSEAYRIDLTEFPAEWDVNGKKAGILRNIAMGDYADALIAFWDRKSKGTKHMIDYMRKLNKPVRVVYIP